MEKILIAGGSGLIGREIIRQLDSEDYIIHILSRSTHEDTEQVKYFQWDLKKQWIEEGATEVDFIINLAGAGIADKKWTEARKKILIDSRVQSASCIQKALESQSSKVKAYISASAIGFYGDSGDQWVDETSSPADSGFLSKCTVQWEKAAEKLATVVNRVAIIRIGIALASDGGAFQKMMIPFQFRMASYFDDGSMYYSWIHIEDIARTFIHAVRQNDISGVFNGVAPEVVTNKKMVETIKDIKSGWYLLNPVPTAALRLAMGEMADVVLTSNRVQSEKIVKAGFEFKYPKLEPAIRALLKH
jgi:uncharacterized protein (TIGR01777 family)